MLNDAEVIARNIFDMAKVVASHLPADGDLRPMLFISGEQDQIIDLGACANRDDLQNAVTSILRDTPNAQSAALLYEAWTLDPKGVRYVWPGMAAASKERIEKLIIVAVAPDGSQALLQAQIYRLARPHPTLGEPEVVGPSIVGESLADRLRGWMDPN